MKNEELKKIRIQRGEEAKKGELRMKGNSGFMGERLRRETLES